MVYEVVHKEPLYRVYSASRVSFANVIKTIFDAIRVLLPLVIIFSTHGLWKKTGTYRERPYVMFEGKYLILSESSDGLIYTSTLPVLNTADPSHFTMAEVQQQWIREDNQDSEFIMNIWLPNMGNFPKNLVFFVFFKYRLDYHSDVEAEVVLHDSLQVAENSSAATILGRMTADQKEPFRWRERYLLFDPDRRDAEHFKPIEIATRAIKQPFNVRLDRVNESLIQGHHPTQLGAAHLLIYRNVRLDTVGGQIPPRVLNFCSPKIQLTSTYTEKDGRFHLTLSIVISEDEFTYRTDTWELLKWAIVQYYIAYAILNYFINRFLTSLFESGLIEAIPCCK